MLSPVAIAYRAISSSTNACSVTPTMNNQRMSGPNTRTSRGHMYDSPMPTPSATRNTVGPRMCREGGASGSFRIGIGSSRPAFQTFSVTAAAGSSGTSEVLLVTSKADSLVRRQLAMVTPPRRTPPISRRSTVAQRAGVAGPAVLRTENLDRGLGGVRVRDHTVVEQVLRRLLDLDVAGQRGHHRLVDALGPEFLDDVGDQFREHHRRRHDRVPVAQDEGVDPLVGQP